MLEWCDIKELATTKLIERQLSDIYKSRFTAEIKEIEKQGANAYWVQLVADGHKYESNKNGLVLPWLLDMTNIDPLTAEHKYVQQTDWPDIDFDCLPIARDEIKEYAAIKYGHDKVCSVGAWQTYKFKSALQDVVRGLNGDLKQIIDITKNLPNDVDDLKDGGYGACNSCKTKHNAVKCPACGAVDASSITIGQILDQFDSIRDYYVTHKREVDLAVRMVGKIKSLSKHAGGLIISSKELFGNMPMAMSNGHWTSLWTEGRNTQLSKLGYIKWDVLGLKTLQYINTCCKLIEYTRGFKFNTIPWKDLDPTIGCMGYYVDDHGEKHSVPMNDPGSLKMMNDLRTQTVFQFETDVQKGVLANGVRNFNDLQVYNAMGHPGPIACIRSSSEISTDGDKIAVENLNQNEHKLAYFNKSGQVSYTSNYKVIKTGVRKLMRIKLKSGKVIDLTDDHKVFTKSGYIKAGELNYEHKVAVVGKQ